MSVTLSPTQHQVTVNPTTNVVTVTAPGPVGPQGGAGQITSATATASEVAVDSNGNSQSPTASITLGGTTTQRTMAFSFGVPTGKSGVIQSVAVTGSDGIQVDSGSPITTATGTIALGVDASALRTHINVEDGATGDQTNAEIRAAVEAATDSNVFTDADHTKLNGIETGATADQTGAEIKTAYENESDTNAFTDAEKTKLSGIATGAEVNVQSDFNAVSGDAFILNKPVVGDGGLTQNNFTDALKTKLDGIEASADVTDATNVDAAGAVMNSDTTTASMSFVIDDDTMGTASDTKLSTSESIKAYVDASVVGLLDYKGGYNANTDTPNIEASATGVKKGDVYAVTHAGSFHSIDLEVGDVILAEVDQAGSQSDWTVVNKDLNAGSIKTSYESNSNTNAFTDAEKTKLGTVETNAAADQTGAEIKSLYEGESNTNAFTDALLTKLNGIEAGATADQTASEIKTAYESNNDTNAFTDALLTKLNSVESSADVTDTANVNSAGAFMHTDIPDSDTGFVKRTGSETYDIDTSTYDPEGTGVAMSIALG